MNEEGEVRLLKTIGALTATDRLIKQILECGKYYCLIKYNYLLRPF